MAEKTRIVLLLEIISITLALKPSYNSVVLLYMSVFHCINVYFGSSLLPVVCRKAHVLFTLFVLACA
jgi:hypothetical protein